MSFLTLYDEDRLLGRLEKAVPVPGSDAGAKEVRRVRHKLRLRRLQRRHGVRTLDWDAVVDKATRREDGRRKLEVPETKTQLDRYQKPLEGDAAPPAGVAMVRGSFKEAAFRSPYTGRDLCPFIRREFELTPPKLQLHQELLSHPRVASASPPQPAHPVDFCYVRPWHVEPVNRLAREFFWPGIDLSECLSYPDFSCVALHRRLVVGFAFLVPDLSHTEAYISYLFVHPDWRRGGIAKFMIYHLIQTCSGRDITLHVSANNPAALLYQNFGFKVEERVSNFYDKYLPPGSKECKHALFLRLSR